MHIVRKDWCVEFPIKLVPNSQVLIWSVDVWKQVKQDHFIAAEQRQQLHVG